MVVYRSKVDWWLMVLVFGTFIYGIAEGVLESDYILLSIMILIIFIIFFLFSQIRYIINNGVLEIKGGLSSSRVPVSDIKSVCKTCNPLSAPALSVNRLEIKYGNSFDYLLISPGDSTKFVAELIKFNPNIDVKI